MTRLAVMVLSLIPVVFDLVLRRIWVKSNSFYCCAMQVQGVFKRNNTRIIKTNTPSSCNMTFMKMNSYSSLQKSFTPHGVEVVSIKVCDNNIFYITQLQVMRLHSFLCLLHREASINHNPTVTEAHKATIPGRTTAKNKEGNVTH